MVGVLLWGAIAVTGTIDQWRYHLSVVDARDRLLRHGVAAEHIDAGYALTGWWLYAHAPTGPPSRGRDSDVPWITGWRPCPTRLPMVLHPHALWSGAFAAQHCGPPPTRFMCWSTRQ